MQESGGEELWDAVRTKPDGSDLGTPFSGSYRAVCYASPCLEGSCSFLCVFQVKVSQGVAGRQTGSDRRARLQSFLSRRYECTAPHQSPVFLPRDQISKSISHEEEASGSRLLLPLLPTNKRAERYGEMGTHQGCHVLTYVFAIFLDTKTRLWYRPTSICALNVN